MYGTADGWPRGGVVTQRSAKPAGSAAESARVRENSPKPSVAPIGVVSYVKLQETQGWTPSHRKRRIHRNRRHRGGALGARACPLRCLGALRPDKASLRIGVRLNLRDRLVALERLLDDASFRPKTPLKGAYRQDWLSRTLVELAQREGKIA
jgi:hypothetical protein